MDPDLFKPKAWENFLLTGKLFDESNSFILEKENKENEFEHMPIFIVGCGRSGTTLIGKMLNEHPNVLFLNEPRSIWLSIFSELDVWSMNALLSLNKTLCPLKCEDLKKKRKELNSFYGSLLHKYRKQIIVDKFPSHSFRIDLLRRLYPKCKIIHVCRNGQNVAKSIAKFTKNAWYGIDGKIKWNALKTYIVQNELINNFESVLDGKSLGMFEMGMIEWTASILSIRNCLNCNDDTNYLKVTYEEITHLDKDIRYKAVKTLFEFVNDGTLKDNDNCIHSAMNLIKPRKICIEHHNDNVIFEETRLLILEFQNSYDRILELCRQILSNFQK